MARDAKIYVLDTSVLLSDPRAMTRFDEHQVVLPVVVITELEGKRHHPELGYFARKALHVLDELRVTSGRLDQSIPVGSRGGTLRVELGLTEDTVLPSGMRLGDNDTKILAVAAQLAANHGQVTLVTKDLPMRIKASSIGLNTEDYRGRPHTAPDVYQGVVYGEMSETDMAKLYRDGTASPESVVLIHPPVEGAGDDSAPVESLDQDAYSGEAAPQLGEQPVHTGVILTSQRGSALATLGSDGLLHVVRTDRELFGVKGRSAEQRIAIDHLINPEIGIVSLGGRAGTGKSALALAAGLDAVVERREHRKVLVFRPIYAVGGQTLGYLPGSGEDKMDPWSQAVFDTLSSIVSPEVMEEVITRGLLEVLPLTHIRGRSLHDAFVIVDEAQSLERNVLLTVLSRMGQNAKIVLTHDVSQRDNLRVGRFDGIAAVIEDLKGSALFSHTTLVRSERSAIADLVTSLLDY
ncbi:PhoH family protein [Mobiluncus mulieris]|uniref:PhoH family protein n=1 Tax=Mobiluncus mulieris TaxID=2052 RepID=UPI0021E26E5F|nr:PhoH family protein [Mobiluncus mulieris]MCU9972916.1 PhoH family protein [Mobiluncus mulieris]